MLSNPFNRPYLLLITNLYCNHRCTYCIQQKSSLDVRLNSRRIDVPQVLKFLEKNRIDRSVRLMGGEATLHPEFEMLMDGLTKLYGKVTITTNVNGKWYHKFDEAAVKMKKWGSKVKWNTTFHPGWMDVDVYIERIRKLQEMKLNLDQIATTDTPDLKPEVAEKLHKANINWRLQTFTGRAPDGRMLPQSWADVNTKYPQLYDPTKYIKHYEEFLQECEDANYNDNFYRKEWVNCKTSKFLIGPDNNIYPCHRHLYTEDKNYIAGNIYDVNMEKFKYKWSQWSSAWELPCNTKCNPCDFRSVKITPLDRPNRMYKGDASANTSVTSAPQ